MPGGPGAWAAMEGRGVERAHDRLTVLALTAAEKTEQKLPDRPS